MSYNINQAVSMLFVLMIVLLPMGWILMSQEPPGPYYATESSQVDAALKATGLSLCDKSPSTWSLNGATGGYSILISDNCKAQDLNKALYIHTQNFDSVQSRDSAMKLIQNSINKNDINGAVYALGSYVIAVQGPTGGEPVKDTIARVKAAVQK